MSTLDTLLSLTEKFSGSEAITLHPERCLNTRFRMRNCSLCADVCPAEGAINVTNGKPSLDNEACLHCGLCLHHCPTQAYTRPDNLPGKLVKLAASLPAGPVDLVCPIHPSPEVGPAPQAVQTKRCLAALSPAVLLELAAQNREVWLDDTHCAACPIGNVQPAVKQTVSQANSWAGLLAKAGSILLRTGENELPPAVSRPVYNADKSPISRRGLFSSFKKIGQEVTAAEEQVEMVKTGKSVPVSERLPHNVPHQRAELLSILEKHSPGQAPDSTALLSNLPVSNLHVDPTRCTACTLCAKFCPTGALKYLSDGESFALTFQPSLCLGPACNICVLACPEQAVSAQPVSETLKLFTKKPLAAGDLTPCKQCNEPIAKGSNLPDTCFACRPKNNRDLW